MTDPSRSGSNRARPPESPLQPHDVAPTGGFAVVELFTSQGCSSCPPAEEVLTEIERDARKRGQPVFALGFHVDYWDYLGWPDQFADVAYSARQQAYARAFGSGQLYTPQMVVNGSVEFVGSDRRRAATAIASALTVVATTPLALSVEDAAGGTGGGHRVVVDYRTERPPERAVLNVAIVERGLESEVARGENAGRTLRQDNVVRAFTSVGLDAERGRVELEVSPDLDPQQASVVGYVQHDGDKAIVGAAALDMSTEPG
ncbi:DUF1223 domain-containing protein [Micromonospora sp. 4G57]|uniref:DUF1223 domain-containing protein n=1 Tax=Micromonospora sicca TaxID=2202420 RepID=A0ABU5JJB4_9ACTN|nr:MULTISPECIES: DUF1223 domain-containing protein [unclassified Micromonospora]MDZ5445932.1 DUF1223 domain-containing protein [Micromonospora sp. 4G57]MDZ5492718.1 DUF1223 domain-containing protein [Micromonospora sp. 4G53]